MPVEGFQDAVPPTYGLLGALVVGNDSGPEEEVDF